MKQQDYNCSITAQVSPREAFDAINRVSEWWTASLEGDSKKLNDVFTVRWGDTYVTMKLTEVEPNKKIVWSVPESYIPWLKDKDEWTGTQMVYEISGDGDATTVHMTHVGLMPDAECYDECRKGWNFFVTKSLYQLLTTGKGRPDEPQNEREN